ncbi:MAG: hypothetical protein ACRD22_13125 [Terriglobia bacterium]
MSLTPEEASKLKKQLKEVASEQKIDLTDAANRYTLWVENGPQGFLCWGKAPYPYEVYRLLGHHMFAEAVILEATKSGSRITRIRAEAEQEPDRL